jgi:hypothetical protein
LRGGAEVSLDVFITAVRRTKVDHALLDRRDEVGAVLRAQIDEVAVYGVEVFANAGVDGVGAAHRGTSFIRRSSSWSIAVLVVFHC